MTTPADDAAVEDAFEAYLAGRPVPEEAADLAVFSDAVRATATTPGRPNAALAELLATGLLTDQSSPSVRTARAAGSPPSRVRIRRRTAMIFSVLFAKFLSAGAVAQAATGAGIVVVAVTGAGAVGVLPDPVQDTVAGVVETVTPLDLPSTDDEVVAGDVPTTEPVTEDVTEEVVEPDAPAEAAEFDAQVWADQGPEGYDSFGAWVSQGAHNKDLLEARGVRFSTMVRDFARAKGMDDRELESELESEGLALEELTEGATEVTPEVEEETAETQVAPAPAERTQGNGKAKSTAGDKSTSKGAGKGNGRN